VRPDQLERRLRQRLDALGPAPRAELLHVLMRPDFDRADRIGLGAQDQCRGTSGRGALASSPDWSVVLPRVGLLTAFAIVCGWFATRPSVRINGRCERGRPDQSPPRPCTRMS
jgi:hypothetical protein